MSLFRNRTVDRRSQGNSPRMGLCLGATVLMLTCLWGQTRPFAVGERLEYTTGFRLLSVGYTTIEITGEETVNGDTTLRIVSRTRTDSFFDRLYYIRDDVVLWVDAQSLELRRMERDINEGRYHLQDTARVDTRAGTILTRTDTIALEPPVFGAIGAVYYLRTLPLQQGDRFPLSIFDGRKIRRIGITVDRQETIQVPAGEFSCLVLTPTPLDDQPLTKVQGLLKVWLTADERRLPVRIEQQSKYGTMVLRLAKVQ